mmetsp:Transcript_5904/g.15215  ORF Transcript_5904/g.15215 Transcript_5904/m.15215 type:complete len:204 (+) Transcript_5904:417-1028(+)
MRRRERNYERQNASVLRTAGMYHRHPVRRKLDGGQRIVERLQPLVRIHIDRFCWQHAVHIKAFLQELLAVPHELVWRHHSRRSLYSVSSWRRGARGNGRRRRNVGAVPQKYGGNALSWVVQHHSHDECVQIHVAKCTCGSGDTPKVRQLSEEVVIHGGYVHDAGGCCRGRRRSGSRTRRSCASAAAQLREIAVSSKLLQCVSR